MKFIKLFGFLVVICCFLFNLEGCLVAGIGAGVGAWKYGNAKKAEAQGKDRASYNQYVLGMHNINFQRQKSGLKPEPVMTYEQYLGHS